MNDFLALPMIQPLGLTLLHFLWQGSIVGIVLFVLLYFLRKPQLRYAVSCAALLALAVLPLVTFAKLYEAPVGIQSPATPSDVITNANTTDENVGLEPPTTLPEQPAQDLVEKSRLTLYLPWIVLAWFVGAFVFSCKLLLSFIALQRYKTKGVKLAEQRLQLKLLEFAKRLDVKQRITLLESKLVPVPVVFGWLRPIILLPTSVVTGLSPKQLEITLNVRTAFKTAEPAPNAIVSTTPTFSWERVPDALKYLVMVHDMKTWEQVVYQMVDTENLTLELPLATNREYQWLVVAFDKNGKMMNTSPSIVFRTE